MGGLRPRRAVWLVGHRRWSWCCRDSCPGADAPRPSCRARTWRSWRSSRSRRQPSHQVHWSRRWSTSSSGRSRLWLRPADLHDDASKSIRAPIPNGSSGSSPIRQQYAGDAVRRGVPGDPGLRASDYGEPAKGPAAQAGLRPRAGRRQTNLRCWRVGSGPSSASVSWISSTGTTSASSSSSASSCTQQGRSSRSPLQPPPALRGVASCS